MPYAPENPSSNREINALEMVQNHGMRMISRLKGRRGVTEAKEGLQLQLDVWQNNSQVKRLHKTLSKEESHSTFSASYADKSYNQK